MTPQTLHDYGSWAIPLGGLLLFACAVALYRLTRSRSRLLLLLGLILLLLSSILQQVQPMYDPQNGPDGPITLVPLPWFVVCECVVIAAHLTLLIGLLGELFPSVASRLDRLFSYATPLVPDASESL